MVVLWGWERLERCTIVNVCCVIIIDIVIIIVIIITTTIVIIHQHTNKPALKLILIILWRRRCSFETCELNGFGALKTIAQWQILLFEDTEVFTRF